MPRERMHDWIMSHAWEQEPEAFIHPFADDRLIAGNAFAAGGAVALTPRTIADGTTAPFDPTMFQRLATSVQEWVVVREAHVRTAVASLARDLKVVAEAAGALAFAALSADRAREHAVAIVSGGNIDALQLAELLTELPADARPT
jgi:threonine dehydratase